MSYLQTAQKSIDANVRIRIIEEGVHAFSLS
jgi:hypothetical protein